ncbi:glutamine amidotransferase-like class 1 domain-containing protein 3, mitochondrial [Halyomorpha halys]|uniref:glutamine amidotransferase-like class 1 domain-containing protein 3, mitochondrial n=1 Tax=Halyomorpha halys TaxID=286706 RepID=UPI0006D50D60|nr:ES1 protein homolog, mitochondrial-like [Halyomorpha halys]XP_014282999.1 ES1 protein homolog, mitochondrial-like [Halyomorpha halys]
MLRKPVSNFLLNLAHGSPLIKSNRFMSCDPTKIAVVLSGCGVYDGTEIHEAASVLSHLTRNGAVPCCFAPDAPQLHVIDHLKGEEDKSHKRNILNESARIARGNIQNLCKLIETQSCYEAVIFPGGFGAAKNLSDYAVNGIHFTIQPEVEQILKDFQCAKKPIALCCISPILAAKLICNVNITLGRSCANRWPHRSAIEDARKLGAICEETDVSEFVFDKKNLVFSTPAFMFDGLFHEIDDGIGVMIRYMLTHLKQKYPN